MTCFMVSVYYLTKLKIDVFKFSKPVGSRDDALRYLGYGHDSAIVEHAEELEFFHDKREVADFIERLSARIPNEVSITFNENTSSVLNIMADCPRIEKITLCNIPSYNVTRIPSTTKHLFIDWELCAPTLGDHEALLRAPASIEKISIGLQKLNRDEHTCERITEILTNVVELHKTLEKRVGHTVTIDAIFYAMSSEKHEAAVKAILDCGGSILVNGHSV